MDNINGLGLKLLELRQENNLTQKQLCSKLNISRANYSYFENGRRIPDLSTLLLIAKFYSISLDELVSYSPDSFGGCIKDNMNLETAVSILQHLKAKHISLEDIKELSKADFDFLMDYKKLSAENKDELAYLMAYKLRKQEK